MEDRLKFLAPWCAVLKNRIRYLFPQNDEEAWDTRKRVLRVWIPQRCDGEANLSFTQEDEIEFQKKFQNVQEALALLSAVASVDPKAWRFLVEKECGVNFGAEGEELFEQEVPAQFLLSLNVEARSSEEEEDYFDSDLVRFCGVDQLRNVSEGYLETLEKIAALGGNVKAGIHVKIPVYVRLEMAWKTEFTKLLGDIWRAEKTIRAQWTAERQEVESTSFSCTFELQPIQVDFTGSLIHSEMANMIDKLVNARGVNYRSRVNECVNSILEMLGVNQGLNYLDVFLHQDQFTYIDSLRKHHLEPLCRSLQALPIDSKAAFLSVVSHSKSGAGMSALYKADQYVLSTIFSFAAVPVLRQVYVRSNRWRDCREEEII